LPPKSIRYASGAFQTAGPSLATTARGIHTWKGNTMTSSSSAAKGAPQWAQNLKG
jgi:hypothetical protein